MYISLIHIGDDTYTYGTAESDISWYQLGEGFFPSNGFLKKIEGQISKACI